MPLSPPPFTPVHKSTPEQSDKGNEIECIHIGKEGLQLCLFTDGIHFYVENSKDSIYTHKKNC